MVNPPYPFAPTSPAAWSGGSSSNSSAVAITTGAVAYEEGEHEAAVAGCCAQELAAGICGLRSSSTSGSLSPAHLAARWGHLITLAALMTATTAAAGLLDPSCGMAGGRAGGGGGSEAPGGQGRRGSGQRVQSGPGQLQPPLSWAERAWSESVLQEAIRWGAW